MKKNLVAVLAAVVMTASMVACGSAAADRRLCEGGRWKQRTGRWKQNFGRRKQDLG